ncbi:MAG: hypothetical protein ABFR75_14880 [Acidobacteriota bacterium]
MRKFLIFCVILYFGFFNIFLKADGISISNPHSEKVWYKGLVTPPITKVIKWYLRSTLSRKVKIDLLRPGNEVPVLVLEDSFYCSKLSREHKCTVYLIPDSVPEDQYRIRITTINNNLNNKLVGYSEVFSIKRFRSTTERMKKNKSLTFKKSSYLKVSVDWLTNYSGKYLDIKWTCFGKGQVKLQLHNDKKVFIRNIIVNPHSINNRSNILKWKIPLNTKTGYYRVRIATLDEKNENFSNRFKIIRSPMASKKKMFR